MRITRIMTNLGVAVSLLAYCGMASAQWTKLGGSTPNASTCLLLTDGTVICQNGEQSNGFQRLTPDQFGSYANGSWTSTGNLPSGYGPLYYCSAVLPDGRVLIQGGEYNTGTPSCPGNPSCDVTLGAIFDPLANSGTGTWTAVNPPNSGNSPWNKVGDAMCTVLPSNTLLLASQFSQQLATFDASTLTYTNFTPTNKADSNSEEGWTLLPNGTLLTVDTQNGTQSEIYTPLTQTWALAGSTQVTLPSAGGNSIVPEMGPQVLRPDGTVFAAGATQNTAIYNSANNPPWTQGPTFPLDGSNNQLVAADAPGAILPNGNVLVAASPFFNNSTEFFEFDGTNLNDVGTTGNSGHPSYNSRMLVLPSGDILVTDGSNDIELYNNSHPPQDAWRPVITAAPNSVDPGTTYSISGNQFNGLSQGAYYGDDATFATNYPLVRITNPVTGHVFYARTHDHSSMGVEAVGSKTVITTQFDTPNDPEITGLCNLQVVANGIPSKPYVINGPGISIPGPVSLTTCQGGSTTATLNICNTGKLDLSINNITSSDPQFSVTNPGYSLVISPDACFPFQVNYTPSGTGTTNATLTVASNDPNFPMKSVPVTGNSPAPSINATIVNSGNFGSTCPNGQSTLTLQITNQSQCNLVVSGIGSSNSGLFVPPTLSSSPLTLTADATVDLPVAFTPTNQPCSDTAGKTGIITITSNDATGNSNLAIPVQGIVPCPHINSTFANSGSYGNICSGNFSDMNLQLLNTGQCNLNIASITSTNAGGFILPANTTYPLVLSADANVNIPVRFQPSGVCSNTVPQSSTITVNSNDPSTPSLTQNVSGIEGCPKLVLSPQNLSGIYAYPATVSDPTGTLGCYTDKQITVSNSGICPLTITSLATSNGLDGKGLPLPASPLEFSVINPTTPITIAPGAAPVPVTIRFRPQILTDQNSMAPDQQTGTLNIASNDPMAVDNSAGLCGEPTYHSGARVLVVDTNNNPVSSVAKITLSSKGLTPGFSETLQPSPALIGAACGNPIQFHLDNETLKPAGTTGNSPRASYVLNAKNGSTQANMSFTLGQCQMQQIILQVK